MSLYALFFIQLSVRLTHQSSFNMTGYCKEVRTRLVINVLSSQVMIHDSQPIYRAS